MALVGLGTVLTALTLVWLLSVKLRDASIADVCWGSGFVLLAWLYCLLPPTLTSRLAGSRVMSAAANTAGRATAPRRSRARIRATSSLGLNGLTT